jgi:hypothetical protein
MAVTNQQIIDFLLTNPGMSDADIVKAMETYGVSPAQMASAVGLDEGAVASRVAVTIPEGQAKLLGDTWVQPVYQVIGSGEDRQVGGIENVLTYKTTGGINDAVATGTNIQYYSPTGEYQQTTQTQPVAGSFLEGLGEALTDPVVLAALAGGYGAGLFGGAGALGGTTGLTLAELGGTAGAGALTAGEAAALYGTGATGLSAGGAVGGAGASGLGTTVAGMGTGTGITVGGAGGLGGATGAAGLGTGVGTGLTVAGAGGLGGVTGATGLGGSLGAGLTAGAGLTGTGILTGSGLGTTLLGTGAGALTGTGVLTGSGLGTTLLGTGAGTGVTGALTTGVGAGTLGAGALTTGVGAGLGAGAATGLGGLTAAQLGSLLSGGLTTAGGLLQQQTSREAAIAAQAMIDRETAAAKKSAQFRPVGMTSRFGTSQFGFDPVTGQLTTAGYTLSPEAKNAQDRLVKLAESGLQQAEGAQAQFAPLQTAAQSLYGLGQGYLNAQTDPRLAQIASQYLTQSPESKMLTSLGGKYIAQSPEAVAQNYLNQQMALLQPGRELELANLQNRLQQQGRGGLSVAQGGTLGATTPELQALYNARATQEAQLAANAQQAGQQQVQFGAGLVGSGQQLGIQGQQFGMNTLAAQQALEQQRLAFGSGLFNQGAGLMGQYYGGQQAAYAPYTTALGGVQNLEALGQQPLTMGAGLGQQAAQAGANVGQLGLRGAEQSVALATGRAATTNPYSTLLGGLGAAPAFGTAAGNAIYSLFS